MVKKKEDVEIIKEGNEEEEEMTEEQKYFAEVDRIALKLQKEEKLVPSEISFWNDYQARLEAAKARREAEVEAERKKRVVEEYKKLQKEFEEANEEDKLTIDKEEDGKVSTKPKNYLIQNFLTKRVLKQAKKNGGSIILKAFGDSGIEFIWSKKPVKFIEFIDKNEQGEEIKNICRIVKTKHRLKGTSIPIHICAEGVFENINLFEGAETDLSAEYVNKAVVNAYQGGLHRGLGMKNQMGLGGKLADYMPFMMLVMIGCVLVLIWMMSQLWEKVGAIPGVS